MATSLVGLWTRPSCQLRILASLSWTRSTGFAGVAARAGGESGKPNKLNPVRAQQMIDFIVEVLNLASLGEYPTRRGDAQALRQRRHSCLSAPQGSWRTPGQ